MKMQWIAAFLLLVLSTPALILAQGQEPGKKATGQGYAFFGVGAVNAEDSILHFGGGGEAVFAKGLGFGAELGYLVPRNYFSDGVGVLSLNGYYEFRRRHGSKVIPFATGGYSLVFRQGAMNAINFGGGVHYWVKEKLGIRFEIRDHLSPSYFDVHAWQGRIGIEFR